MNTNSAAISEGLAAWAGIQAARAAMAQQAAEAGTPAHEFLQARRLRANLRRKAETYGLAYWPALFMSGIDPRAFVSAERILSRDNPLWGETLSDGTISHGGWDSYGCHGLSPEEVKKYWFAAGCRDSSKFRWMVAHRTHLGKGESLKEGIERVRGERWLGRSGLCLTVSPKAARVLGRVSVPLRYALMAGVTASGRVRYFPAGEDVDYDSRARHTVLRWETIPVRIRDLNLTRAAEVQRMPRWKQYIQPEIPDSVRWWALVGARKPLAEGSRFVNELSPTWVPVPLCRELAALTAPGEIWPVAALRLFWGKEYPRARASLYDGVSEHDAGQPLCAPGIDREFFTSQDLPAWRRLAWATKGVALKYAARFTEVRAHLGHVPDSLGELERTLVGMKYSYIPPAYKDITPLAARFNLSRVQVMEYCTLYAAEQANVSTVPGIRIHGSEIGLEGEWILRRLDTDDFIGPMLGLATNCCQHLHGDANSCACAIWTHADCGAWVVEYRGSIVAQSFVWRRENLLVIDSIEALSAAYVEGIAALYLAAARKIVAENALGCTSVAVGHTSYGITKNCREIWMAAGMLQPKQSAPSCPTHYTDAKHIHVIGEPQ